MATVHNLTSKHLLLSEAVVARRDDDADGADGSLFSMRDRLWEKWTIGRARTLLAELWLYSQRWDAMRNHLYAN
jgi:hypothetical protein